MSTLKWLVASTRPEPDRLTGLRRLPFVAPMGHQARTLRDSYAQSRSRPPLAAQLFERYKAGWTAGEVLETEMVPKPLRVSLAGAPKRRVDLSGGVALSVDPQLLPKSFTLALIEQMARYKLNRLTLHLTDDIKGSRRH